MGPEHGLKRPPKIYSATFFFGPVRSGIILVHSNRLHFALSTSPVYIAVLQKYGIGTLITMTEVEMATAASEAKPKPDRL
jgi:hypothetical protein